MASLLVVASGFSSCDDDKAMPPVPVPGSGQEIPEATATILEFKEAFNDADPNAFSYSTLVGEKEDGSHWIISGKVVSSDASGNIYKNLMIEDETAGLTIAIDQTKLYQTYHMGQTVTIDCTGLYMGAYGRCMQLGWEPLSADKQQPSRISEEVMAQHAICWGFPEEMTPELVTVEQLTEARKNNTDFIAMQSRYVKLENMEFEDAGETLAVQGSSTSRYAFDEQGNRICLYNSGQSTIWANTLPSGKGTIVGIISYYNNTWQLLLNGLDDLQGFSGSTAPLEMLFSESFSSGAGTFTIENELLPDALTYVWSFASNYSCMKASAFANSTNYATSSRLVSPQIDLTGSYTTINASYDQACNYFSSLDAAKGEAQFEVSTDDGTTWTALEVPNFTDAASWTFRTSGPIDLSAYKGQKIRVAFHYSSDAKAGTWEVKNLKITAQ